MPPEGHTPQNRRVPADDAYHSFHPYKRIGGVHASRFTVFRLV